MSLRLQRAALVQALIVLSCAHQMTPSGGPDDRTGPSVQSTKPEQGSVNVDRRCRCVITFSEWIAKTTAAKSVSVLPSLDGGVKVRVSGKRIEIIPARGFAESTTYHVIVTGTLQDLHSNPVAASYTLVFSTGSALDSGTIAGCVAGPSLRAVRPTAALFRAGGAWHDSVLFTVPDYLTQADSAAFFAFENIRPGDYRLMAFIDKNGNNRLDPGAEDAYAPAVPLVTVGSRADTLRLYPAASDTAAPRLASAKAVSPDLVLCAFNRRPDSARGCSGLRWAVECLDDSCASPAVSGFRWIGGGPSCALLLSGALMNAPYRVISCFSLRNSLSSAEISDSLRFNGLSVRDTVAPVLSSAQPAGFLPLRPEIPLRSSEPVMVTAPLFLADSLGDTVRLAADTGYADSVVLTPTRSLRPAGRYRLVLLRKSGRDLAGNSLKARDSTDTAAVLRYSVISADSLAVSLKGCVPCLAPDTKRAWRFVPFSGGQETRCADSGGCFRFDSLPYGQGNIGYFIDANGNGRPDAGSLVPWRAPEALVMFPDTVEARARWEVEDVMFAKPCSWCERYEPAAAPAPAKKGTEKGKSPR